MPRNGNDDIGTVRRDLLGAGDQKILRVVAMVDEVGDSAANQTLLDPLRPRIAALRPDRPPRFARLLFMPLDPLIVPARAWRPEQPEVPRSTLPCFTRLVRSGLGKVVADVEARLASQATDQTLVVTRAGESLWPRAAEILNAAAAPADWADTGLRPSLFQPLARGIAAVLWRALALRGLARDAALGVLGPDAATLRSIAQNLADETQLGRAMVIRVLLTRAPHAVALIEQSIASSWGDADRVLLHKALASGMEGVLAHLESPSGLIGEIGRGSLADAGEEVRRTVALLTVLESDPLVARDRSRLRAIRQAVDTACRVRIADGIQESLARPLSDTEVSVDVAGQNRLEGGARSLRVLETAARKTGNPADYEALLVQAACIVREAADAGKLTPVRQCRLVEILAGPEVAEALYRTSPAQNLRP